MKSNLLLFVGLSLVLTAIVIGTAGCDSFTPPSAPKGSPSAIFSQQNAGIWVTGGGKISVVPDLGILSLGVEAQAATVAEAQNQATAAMEAVVWELDNRGLGKKDIKTQHFSIYPVRRWVPEREEEVLVGYRVNNTITAKVRKVEDTAAIIDAVTRAGGDYIRINSINSPVDDPAP